MSDPVVPLQGRFVPRPKDQSSRPLIGSPEEQTQAVGYDPAAFGGAKMVWAKTPTASVLLRPPDVTAESVPLTDEEVEQILASYVPDTTGVYDDKAFVVCVSDQQTGKPDGGGTPVLIEAFHRHINKAAQRIKNETVTGRCKEILLAHLGDACEGAVSQGGRLRHDVGITEEFRLARRMLVHAIGVLAPLCDRLIVAGVPSNHGEARRDQAIKADDNWCLEVVHSASDVVEGRSEFSHVEFVVPEEDEISVAVEVGGIKVGLAHGHVGTRNPNQVVSWIIGQKANQRRPQPLQGCDLILTGHYHHFRYEDPGYGFWWAMSPAMESGSDWFRHRTGKDSVRGVLTGWLSQGDQPLVKDEVV